LKQHPVGLSGTDEHGSSSAWGPIATFVSATYATTWLACLLLRSAVAAGHLWAFFTFLFVTVWSPTAIAIAVSLLFEGTLGVRKLLGLLFRRLSESRSWYVIGVVVPIASVVLATVMARHLHSSAPFIPLAALPFTVALQMFTGAMGEELGWRGFLLSQLQRRFSQRTAAILMGTIWALWHLPSFFLPGMPQQQMPPAAFLLMVAAFGVFLTLLFNRTNGHIISTMLAHFSFNLSLAVGGANIGAAFLWSLASIFSIVAIWSIAKLSRQSPQGHAALRSSVLTQ
jgi:membrane protease YdiL (CAAX protease family)